MEQFSQKNMIKYLKNFNYLESKYLVKDATLINQLEKLERMSQESRLTKQPASYAGETLGRIYGFTAENKIQSSELFNVTFNKIICEYLNITGLENLFNRHYYDFEWDMHLEFDTKTGAYNYYRDHMEHQIRNMYMMLKILEEKDYIVEFKKIILKEPNSRISQYVRNRLAVLVDEEQYRHHYDLFSECACEYYRSVIDKFISSPQFHEAVNESYTYKDFALKMISYFEMNHLEIPKQEFLKIFIESINKNEVGVITEKRKPAYDVSTETGLRNVKNGLKQWIKHFKKKLLIRSYYTDYSLMYIIRSASIISALFHDLSYPLCFSLNMEKRIGEYLPSMNSFVHNLEADIDYVVSVLKPSLLFTMVDEKEIRSMLDKNEKKYDHGVLSAISLLLTFYESGRINKLSLEKQTAIELAAVAIYYHNFSYQIVNKKAKHYYRPVFVKNPISYLLKICDEMQEWERRYFELSKADAPVFCPRCKSPIVEYKYYKEKDYSEDDDFYKSYEEVLLCRCGDACHNKYERSDYFPHRNIYTVTTCKTIDTVFTKNNSVIFRLNYDLVKLLHMTQIACSYSEYRAKELGNLKVLLQNQRFSSADSTVQIRDVYLDYVMTANPIYLKSRILLTRAIEESLNETATQGVKLTISDDFQKYNDEFYKKEKESLKIVAKIINCLDKIIVKGFDKNNYFPKLSQELNKAFNISSEDAFYYKLVLPIYAKCFLKDDKDISHVGKLLANANVKIENKEDFAKYIFTQAADIIYDILDEKATDHLNFLIKRKFGDVGEDDLNLYTKKLLFYMDIAAFISQSLAENINCSKEEFVKHIIEIYNKKFPNSQKRHADIIRLLLEDTYCILENQNDLYNDRIDLKKYLGQFKSEKNVYIALEQYITPANWYDNSSADYKKFSAENLDFNSDLVFFSD